jgi:uncharacterized protein (TIGR02444 family)
MTERVDAAAAFDDEEALWRFSLAVYSAPGVAERLIELQDRYGLDVNLALFAAWLGWSGRGRASRALLERAETAIAPWRRAVVEPLRGVRRALKAREDVEGAAALREAVKRAELDAERAAQKQLVRLLPGDARTAPESPGESDAAANLRLYCELLKVPTERLDFIAFVLPPAGS